MRVTALAAVTADVPGQDEALSFYRDPLGLEVGDDVRFPGGFRWLSVAAPGQGVVFLLEDAKFSRRA